jgi:hypothetical protein
MADPQLSTHDLAGTTDAEDTAEQASSDHRDLSGSQTGQVETLGETKPADEGRNEDDLQAGSTEQTDPEPAAAPTSHDEREPLLPDDQSERFTTQWQEIQTSFVDRPRESVEQADALVADLMQRLAASFSNERERLEAQWDSGDDVSTEDLRVALTRYRSFFDRLLSA